MIQHRRFAVHLLGVCLLLGVSLAPAQTTAPVGQVTTPVGPAQDAEGRIRPETVAARKDTIQKRLERLEDLLLSQDEAEVVKATLDQQVKVLAALEVAFQKRLAYTTQLANLPRQVDALNAERQKLAARPPRRFAEVNEKLRLDHEAQLQATRAELEGWRKELAAGELRLGSIAKDIEQRITTRAQIEKDLLAAWNEAARATEQKPLLLARAELLDVRQQLQQAEGEMLEAEREWLTKQGPLRDAQLGLTQTRYAVLQQELEAIKAALGQAISQESVTLSSTEEEITRRLQQTTDPVETLLLQVKLGTIKLRKGTADYRQQINAIGDQTVEQEKRNTREKQEAEHLASLVEKYVSGERIAQRLQTAFTRLRREQARHDAEYMKAMEVDLDALTGQDLDLEEQLYEFDHSTETRLRELSLALQTMPAAQREAQLARVHKVLDEQKAALREQKQALPALVQAQTKLLTLRRDYKRILEESDQFVLTKLFWLRDGQTMGSRVVQDAVTGASVTASRLQASFRAELALIPLGQAGAVRFWVLVALLGVGLPWVALWGSTRLRPLIASFLTADSTPEVFGTRSGVAALIVVQTAIWPAYIMLVAWAWPRVVMMGQSALNLALPVGASVQLSALVLWCWLLGRTLLRPQGWMQHYWGLSPEVGKALQQTITVGCLATLVFLVPRYVLLHAPGGPEAVVGSLALARLCFTVFQAVLLGLVSVMGRRGSRLMTVVLARSREARGLVWRYWPLFYLAVLAGISIALVLDGLGYHYASRALWLRSGEALLIILALIWLDHAINTMLDRLVARQRPLDDSSLASLPSVWTLLHKARPFVRVALVLVALLVLEHVYDISEGLLSALDHVHVLELSRNKEGQPLWLTLEDVAEALLILASASLVVRHLPGICEAALFPRVRWDAGLRYTFLTLSRYVLIFLALWWSLSAVHLNWSSIQWIIAAVSVGVGFGLQEIVSNFVSGLILLLERPIRVDDIVTVGDQTGTVKRITIRATAIQNADHQTVIIPNKEFIAHRVTNWTLGDTYVRLVLPVGVAYGSDMDLVKRLLTETVSSHPRVLTTPPPTVFLRAFGEHALQWEIWCFVPRPQDRLATANDLLLQIDQAFRQHGIAIPFPQQDIHLRSADAALVIQPIPMGNGYAAVAAHADQSTP